MRLVNIGNEPICSQLSLEANQVVSKHTTTCHVLILDENRQKLDIAIDKERLYQVMTVKQQLLKSGIK